VTNLTFINHASVLIRYEDAFLLTDPWFERPAFGSWLPTFPMFVHPAYLAALGEKLSILISHGHDDHCDDELLALFDKQTPIVSSDYTSPSVSNRIKRIGFVNYRAASEVGLELGPFIIKSFRNDAISLDDATYSIRTPDALIVHCNDNWPLLSDHVRERLIEEVAIHGPRRAVLMSQTNSASGYPLNYRNFDRDDRLARLVAKVRGMVRDGTRNTADLGVANFISYAGFASVFVKGHPDYFEDSLMPTAGFIERHFAGDVAKGVKVLDLYPGDEFDFEGVRQSFLGRAYSDEAIKQASARFYALTGKVEACDSFREPAKAELAPGAVDGFLSSFDRFVRSKVDRSGFSTSILGKTLSIIVDEKSRHTVKFGTGLVETSESNKEIFVTSGMMASVLRGTSLFENLYTGYNADFRRNPPDTYNRDIMSYLVMFSYVHLAAVRGAQAATSKAAV